MALRIAVFGQAAFGKDVTSGLLEVGHQMVGVYVPPDRGRPDPLAVLAQERGLALLRHRRFRRKGEAIAELVDEYRALGAQLNVMPYTTVILPPEIVDAPERGSLCFHPSILPKFRGGAAIPWQLILGAEETGVSVFRPDEGVDTGPIVVQRCGIPVGLGDNAASLYFDKLYPVGLEAMLEAVAAVDAGTARYQPQPEEGASFQGLVTDEVARIDWRRPAREVDRLIRGCDPQPGAHSKLEGQMVRLYDSQLLEGEAAQEPGTILGLQDARLLVAASGGRISLGKLRVGEGSKQAAAEAGLAAGARLR